VPGKTKANALPGEETTQEGESQTKLLFINYLRNLRSFAWSKGLREESQLLANKCQILFPLKDKSVLGLLPLFQATQTVRPAPKV
jgi:hypothetical protein